MSRTEIFLWIIEAIGAEILLTVRIKTKHRYGFLNITIRSWKQVISKRLLLPAEDFMVEFVFQYWIQN